MLLGKAELDTIDVVMSKDLIDSYFSNDESISVNNVLREYNEIKEEIKNTVECTIEKQWKPIVSVLRKIRRTKILGVRKTKQNRLMILSGYAVCDKKKSSCIINQQF